MKRSITELLRSMFASVVRKFQWSEWDSQQWNSGLHRRDGWDRPSHRQLA